MEIVIREVLGHLQEADGGVTLFVDAELDGTLRVSSRLTFTPRVTVQGLAAIIGDGIRTLRLRREQALSDSPSVA